MLRRPALVSLSGVRVRPLFGVLVCAAALLGTLYAQAGSGVPHVVKFNGSIVTGNTNGDVATGNISAVSSAAAGGVGVVFALYTQQSGGAPLWQELQTLTVDASGRYSVLLGSASPAGIPIGVFGSDEARWLGVQVQGQAEQPRILLVSVPYAMKAGDAETLGGLPASAFARAEGVGNAAAANAAANSTTYVNQAAVRSATANIAASPALVATGASAGFVPYFTDAVGDLKNSGLFFQSSSGNVGLNTIAPAFNFNVVSQVDPAAIAIDGYGIVGINFVGRRARGTVAAPTAIQANDNIMAMQGRGYGSTGFSASSRANMKFFAAENWSDAAQGTYITLTTTPKGSTAAAERVRITDAGNVGIGTSTPASRLTVNGVIQSTSGGVKFPDGTTQTTAQQANLAALSSGLGTSGYSPENLIYDTSLCMVGDIILSANSYGGGALPADGRLLAISQNTPLFSLLGTKFGGDGITTFALPDLRAFTPNGLQYSICIFGIFPGRI